MSATAPRRYHEQQAVPIAGCPGLGLCADGSRHPRGAMPETTLCSVIPRFRRSWGPSTTRPCHRLPRATRGRPTALSCPTGVLADEGDGPLVGIVNIDDDPSPIPSERSGPSSQHLPHRLRCVPFSATLVCGNLTTGTPPPPPPTVHRLRR
jgi:hypothetical protein